ncbi:MAG TPA: 4a-hydroxytetrahydrobiopterin dehydratase [Candidatus Krumholzibacteria bacterium]|nr:4a-hydroxytetrahydrobiopterin dehydratase [Candidatus Krumholzibacteria bacterium]
MANLNAEKCTACRRDSPAVTDSEIAELRPQIPEWELERPGGVPRLTRRFKFQDFAAALKFTDEVGALAESEGHHPRIITEWGGVEVQWWTHKIRNLHRNDFIMAAKTNELYANAN